MELNQELIFIHFLVLGIVISMLFEVFRRLRKNIKTLDIITFIEDCIFLFISGFLFILKIILINNGIFRFYMIIGFIFGVGIYSLTLRRVYVIILDGFINICKKIFKICYNYLSKCLQMLIKKDF